MIEFVNKYGGSMWVADNRVEEYKAAGYKLAADAVKPTEEKKDGIRNDKRRAGKTRKAAQ